MLLNVDQVAERLNVGPATVWRWSRVNPSFPTKIRLSEGCTRWDADAVERWLAARSAA